MTEDLDFSRMTPAELTIWRMEKAAEEEKAYQARLQRRSELKLQRTESFNEAEGEAQSVSKSLHGHLKLLVEERGKAREVKIQAGLVDEPGILRGHFWGCELGNCEFPNIPEGIGRIRELFEAVGHPRDIEPFKEEGTIYCQRHYAQHAFILSFRGLRLADLNVKACACIKGLHQYKNISDATLSSSPWRWPLGAEFDTPPGAEEDIKAYLEIGYLEDLRNPKKVVPKEEKATPAPQEILKEAVADWDKGDG